MIWLLLFPCELYFSFSALQTAQSKEHFKKKKNCSFKKGDHQNYVIIMKDKFHFKKVFSLKKKLKIDGSNQKANIWFGK
jgi:hypothetical protein